eukprot:757604-Hanusia_phi.AAC.1
MVGIGWGGGGSEVHQGVCCRRVFYYTGLQDDPMSCKSVGWGIFEGEKKGWSTKSTECVTPGKAIGRSPYPMNDVDLG